MEILIYICIQNSGSLAIRRRLFILIYFFVTYRIAVSRKKLRGPLTNVLVNTKLICQQLLLPIFSIVDKSYGLLVSA